MKICKLFTCEMFLLGYLISLTGFLHKIWKHCLGEYVLDGVYECFPVQLQSFGEVNPEYNLSCGCAVFWNRHKHPDMAVLWLTRCIHTLLERLQRAERLSCAAYLGF